MSQIFHKIKEKYKQLEDIVSSKKNYYFIFLIIALITGILRYDIKVPRWDSVTLLETAHRWIYEGRFASSVYPVEVEDICEFKDYKTMTWWAPGVPLLMGGFLKLGFDIENTYKLAFVIPIFLGWIGWMPLLHRLFNHAQSYQLLWRLFSLTWPFCFSPFLDPDQLFFWAMIPIVTYMFSKYVSEKSIMWLALTSLVLVFSVFMCYHSLLFLPVLIFVILWADLGIKRKAVSVCILSFSVFVYEKVRALILGGSAAYLKENNLSLKEVLENIYLFVRDTQLMPLVRPFRFFIPDRIYDYLTAFDKSFPGYLITIFFYCLAAVWVLLFFLNNREKDIAVVLFTLGVFFVSTPFFLIAASYRNNFLFNFFAHQEYYDQQSTLAIFLLVAFLVLSVFGKQLSHFKFIGLIPLVLNIIIMAHLITFFKDSPSRARKYFYGQSYTGDEELLTKKSVFQSTENEFSLENFSAEKNSIIFTHNTNFYYLLNPSSPYHLSSIPSRSFWKKLYANCTRDIYFFLWKDDMLQPTQHTAYSFSKLEDRTALPELEEILIRLENQPDITDYGKEIIVYKARIPKGWAAKELFDNNATE